MTGVTLPKGWITAKIGSLIELNPKNIYKDDVTVGFVPMPFLGKSYLGQIRYESKQWSDVKRGYTHFADGDVLLAKITPCFENGKAGIAAALPNGIGAGSTEYFVCRPLNGVLEAKYLLACYKTDDFINLGTTRMTGSVGHKRVPKDYILESKMPLPPLAEQKRIVDKLDTVLARVDACRERLDGLSPLLVQFRQSVLRSAFCGTLSKVFGEKHVSGAIAQSELAALLRTRGGLTKKIELTSNHDMVLGSFPKRWAVGVFDSVFEFLDYRGKTPNKSPSGKRLITAKNIKMGFLQEAPVEYVSNEDYIAWMTRGFPREGDIFFVTEGHTMGCVALNSRVDEFALAQRTITLQAIGQLNTKFYVFYILSDAFQRLVDINATGTAAKGIKASKLRSLPLPFPSFAEQNEIVRRVEELFAFADRLETRLATARAAIQSLTPSLLAKAFRGELVPQDPYDEPASELLKRLASHRATDSANPRRGKAKA